MARARRPCYIAYAYIFGKTGLDLFSQNENEKVGIWYNIGGADMCMMDEIRAKRDEIYAIARKHKAEKLWVFGSCARREV